MAIQYKEEALPDIAKLDFDVYRWGGLNRIKAAQSDGDMAECKNMSSDNFPYASPRKPRELIKSESGIKRICKIEDGKIFYIDSDNKYCMLSENQGAWTKTQLPTTDINETTVDNITVNQVKCTANYDSSTLFFPDMSYTIPDTINETPNAGGNFRLVERHMKMTKYMGSGNFGTKKGRFRYIDNPSNYDYRYDNIVDSVYIESDNIYIESPNVSAFKIAFELPDASGYAFPESTDPISYDTNHYYESMRVLQVRFFDKYGNIKTYEKTDGRWPPEDESLHGSFSYTCECVEVTLGEISHRREEYTVYVPNGITLEKGDYFTVTAVDMFETGFGESTIDKFRRNLYYLLSAEWYITKGGVIDNITVETAPYNYTLPKNTKLVKVIKRESDPSEDEEMPYSENNGIVEITDTGNFDVYYIYVNNIAVLPLDYAVVYNNRVVGVNKSEIRASALGDFSNYWEYADEAGNPSATGAYATDVGSYGDFTGIAPYNNVLLLFKKDIVYEMYGSMPYTVSELCKTGCIDNDSIVSVNGVMYWASPYGFVRYAGGVPTVISHGTGIKTDGAFKSGTDGRKIYCYDGDRIYVYDTLYNMWHIEDKKAVNMFFGSIDELYFVSSDGIYMTDSGEERIEWEYVTKDFTFNIKERKNLSKIWIRAEMNQNSALEIYVRQDGGEWKRVAVKTAEKSEMFDFKLRVKKFDSFTIKFKGRGDVKILDIHGNVTVGTSKHRSGASLNIYRR